MADENLSFAITFDEVAKLTQEVQRAGKTIGELGDFGREAGRGIDVAAASAVDAAEAILGIGSAARDASAAVNELTTPREIAVDTSEIEEAFAASERLRAEIEQFAAPQAIAIDFTGLDEANRAFEESFAAAQNLRTEIEEFESARAAVDGVKDSVDKLGDSLENAASRADQSVGAIGGSFGRIGTSIASIGKAAAGAFVGFAAFKSIDQIGQTVSNTAKTMVREFLEAEKATVSLSSALLSIGQFSGESVAAVRAFADEIARTTTFEDDAVVSAAALIAQLGRLSGTELTGATESAVQLAAVLGKDLQSAALLVARAAAGSSEALSRYRIVISDSIPEAQRFAEIQRQIAERFGGRAQAELLTFGGSVLQLKKSWNELLESFGRTITIFQPAVNLLTAGLQKANDLLNIPPPRNFLDAAENIEAVTDAMDKLTLATKRRVQSEKTGSPTPTVEEDVFRSRAISELEPLRQSILVSLDEGNVQNLEATFKKLEELRLRAATAGEGELAAELSRLEALRPAGPPIEVFEAATAEAKQATDSVRILIDLLEKSQTIGDVATIDLFDTAKLDADTATVEQLGQRLTKSIDAMETAVGRAGTQSGAVAGPALELFKAFQEAREKFLADFGTIPPAIEAIFQDGLRRAESVIKQFGSLGTIQPVELEIGIKIADPDAIGADIQRIVGDSLTRASAIKFEPIDVESLQIPITIDPNNLDALKLIGTSAEDAEAKLKALAAFTPNLNDAFVEISASAIGFQTALTSGFEIALASILDGTAQFKTAMVAIFKSLVDEAIKQLARLAALKIFQTLLNLIAPGAGTVISPFLEAKNWKIEQPVIPPVAVPIIPDTSGTRKAIDDLLGSIRQPDINPIVADFRAPRIEAVDVPVNFAFPDLEPLTVEAALELQEIQLPDLDKLTVAVDFGEVPALEPQTVAVAADFDAAAFSRQIEAPRFDVGASFERPRFEATESSTLAFSRFVRATQSIAEQRPSRRAEDQLRVERIVPQINISATDGISVRRQLSSGALRREMERAFRRGR